MHTPSSPAHLLLDQLLTERALEQVTRAFEKRDAISATHLRQVLAGALNRDQDDQQIALLCAMVGIGQLDLGHTCRHGLYCTHTHAVG